LTGNRAFARQEFKRDLPKYATGQGLDEIVVGGVSMGRPMLVCRSAGFGKTLLAME
jgi:circadian clock protein KaiC